MTGMSVVSGSRTAGEWFASGDRKDKKDRNKD